MPDIAMCRGEHCSIRETCYRFTAKDTPNRQVYLLLVANEQGESCEQYWPTHEQIEKDGSNET